MKDTYAPLISFALYVAAFLLWAYGVAVCWRADELFWTVVSVFFAPVGFIVGLYNFIF